MWVNRRGDASFEVPAWAVDDLAIAACIEEYRAAIGAHLHFRCTCEKLSVGGYACGVGATSVGIVRELHPAQLGMYQLVCVDYYFCATHRPSPALAKELRMCVLDLKRVGG